MLKPIGDRVIIKPLQNPDHTESGLVLPENRSERYLDMQGIVVAVSDRERVFRCDVDAMFDELAFEAECMTGYDKAGKYQVCDLGELHANLTLCKQAPADVKVGDHVLFSWKDGQEVTIDDDTFLMMRETDILAVLEEEATV